MSALDEYPPQRKTLEKLAESLFEELEKLTAAARAKAEHQTGMEEQIRLLEIGWGGQNA